MIKITLYLREKKSRSKKNIEGGKRNGEEKQAVSLNEYSLAFKLFMQTMFCPAIGVICHLW
ncbi:MAG: hypothetical protein WCT05_01380 [Lentisphaeria bacterium]